MTVTESPPSTADYCARYQLDYVGHGFYILDRLEADAPVKVEFDPASVVGAMVGLGATVLEVDPVGMALGLIERLRDWGGITLVERMRVGSPSYPWALWHTDTLIAVLGNRGMDESRAKYVAQDRTFHRREIATALGVAP